jgi:hypothetical protein
MNLNEHLKHTFAAVALMGALSGCGSHDNSDPAAAAQSQEMERLRQENQDLAQVKTDNEEVRRLRKENQELPKLRSQYQEAGRLKKENEQLRQQIAKLTPAAGQLPVEAPADAASAAATEKPKIDELSLNDGDEVLVAPQYLKKLLPDIDWDKLDRKDPLGIRALIEKDGVQLTNAAQLHNYGITNFIIRRATPVSPAPPADKPN